MIEQTLDSDGQSSEPAPWLYNHGQVIEPLWAFVFLYNGDNTSTCIRGLLKGGLGHESLSLPR